VGYPLMGAGKRAARGSTVKTTWVRVWVKMTGEIGRKRDFQQRWRDRNLYTFRWKCYALVECMCVAVAVTSMLLHTHAKWRKAGMPAPRDVL